ncbi:MAG: hypothetical protein JWL66_1000 [Sphingomonadales bacterium]|nr:hypothetical protein [Sphingomonadales bacterium]
MPCRRSCIGEKHQVGTVERALEIAREGKLKSVSDIIQVLAKEGYEDAYQHLSGHTINRQLRSAMASARVGE